MTAAIEAALSVAIGTADASSGENGKNCKRVDRLRDFPANELAPQSLDALGILVTSGDLLGGEGRFNPMDLSSFVPALRSGASVHVCVVDSGDDPLSESASSSAIPLQRVHSAFLLAGLRGGSESKRADGSRVLSATYSPRPAGECLSTSVGKLLRKQQHQPPPQHQRQGEAVANNPVKIMDDDDDLLDEDALLLSGVLAPPPALSVAASSTNGGNDCGGRKACDNCTCGRADAERDEAEREKKNAGGKDKNNKPPMIQTSSCGKCGLGDAFRCASCPYLGKPAFKPGEEHLVLDLQDDL
jgi:hypothetical protein